MYTDPRFTLQANGISPTPQRLAILTYLLTHRRHPTVDDMYEALQKDIATLSKTTVYNTVRLFVEKGLLKELTIDDNEIRYDIETDFHGHFKCTVCGRTYNFPVSLSGYDPALNGFNIRQQDVFFQGICPECSQHNRTTHERSF